MQIALHSVWHTVIYLSILLTNYIRFLGNSDISGTTYFAPIKKQTIYSCMMQIGMIFIFSMSNRFIEKNECK